MVEKILKFINLPYFSKKEIIGRNISFLNKKKYGNFGKKSFVDKPIIISNKKHIFIGNNVVIRRNLRMEPIKFWRGKEYNPKIYIGDNTSIEQNCHITCANKVDIGSNVTILGYCCVTDINHEYKDINKKVLEQEIIVYETSIGDGSFIGMGSRIMAGVTIGKHCVIGANSVVNKDIPNYSVAVGIPAKIIKRYDFESEKWKNTNSKGEFLD